MQKIFSDLGSNSKVTIKKLYKISQQNIKKKTRIRTREWEKIYFVDPKIHSSRETFSLAKAPLIKSPREQHDVTSGTF